MRPAFSNVEAACVDLRADIMYINQDMLDEESRTWRISE